MTSRMRTMMMLAKSQAMMMTVRTPAHPQRSLLALSRTEKSRRLRKMSRFLSLTTMMRMTSKPSIDATSVKVE